MQFVIKTILTIILKSININNIKQNKINKEVNKYIFYFIREDKLINIEYRYFKLDSLKLLFLLLWKKNYIST